jgi:Tfp pilus assembly protein PilZ
VSEGRSQRAIVLDLSETGLFVQTGTRLPPGSEVEVLVRLAESVEPVRLRAQVARNKQVPPQLTSVARGGVGLRILDAPPAYYQQIDALDGSGKKRSPADAAPAPTPTPAPAPAKLRFRVRVKQNDGPRSRSLEIVAASADEARARALADVGSGWEAVAAEALA